VSLALEKALMYEDLGKSEERYRSLVENINLGIAFIDTNHRIVMQNKALCKMFGKSVTEFIGRHCFREYEKRAKVCDHCPSVMAMATGVPAEAETEGVRDDGSRFVARIMCLPVYDRDGHATGFIDIVQDITKRKEYENQLEESKKRLQTFFDGISEPMLMTAIDGARSRTKIYGWIEPGVNFSTSGHTNLPQGYNHLPNIIAGQQGFERRAEDRGTDSCAAAAGPGGLGPRCDHRHVTYLIASHLALTFRRPYA